MSGARKGGEATRSQIVERDDKQTAVAPAVIGSSPAPAAASSSPLTPQTPRCTINIAALNLDFLARPRGPVARVTGRRSRPHSIFRRRAMRLLGSSAWRPSGRGRGRGEVVVARWGAGCSSPKCSRALIARHRAKQRAVDLCASSAIHEGETHGCKVATRDPGAPSSRGQDDSLFNIHSSPIASVHSLLPAALATDPPSNLQPPPSYSLRGKVLRGHPGGSGGTTVTQIHCLMREMSWDVYLMTLLTRHGLTIIGEEIHP
jgi:hypothetical protein